MSEEIIKQKNKKAERKPEFQVFVNESIVFKHKLDPNTGEGYQRLMPREISFVGYYGWEST